MKNEIIIVLTITRYTSETQTKITIYQHTVHTNYELLLTSEQKTWNNYNIIQTKSP